ncbi:MAG: hypothetical protein V9H26_08180 [Verrucomicrobiota bacterium]
MSGVGARLALVVASLAVGGAGFVAAQQLGDDGPTGGTVLATADFFGCDVTVDATVAGATSLGQVHVGDQVWMLGVTGDRWAVIRRPEHPLQPVWLPLAMVATEADAGDLPDLSCTAAVDVATATTAPTATPTTATAPGAVTTIGLDTTTSSSTSTTSSTTTTLLADVTPPTVTVTTDRAHLYVMTDREPCASETALEVTIVLADPTLPLTIRSIVATWSAPSGPQTANLVPVGGTRFRLEVPANGPAGGETPLTLTATGVDGAGNVGTGTAVVSLRDPASFGCGG